MRSSLAAASLIAATACQVAVAHNEPLEPAPVVSPTVAYITASGAAAALPFSSVVRVGDMLYLSGQLGVDPATGKLVPGGIGEETRRAMENIKTLVEANGSSMERVVKCTVMLADIKEWGAMNAVYVTFFPSHKPARSAFGTSGLVLGGRAEIECLAVAAG